MNLDLMETKADMLLRGALFADYKQSPWLRRETVTQFRNSAIETYCEVISRTKSARRTKRAEREIKRVLDYISRDRSNELYCLEHRAKRREDVECWEALGYRVFDVCDSYAFSTGTSPMYDAESVIKREIEALKQLGYEAHAECPDYEYHTQRCSYWGGTYGYASGHVVCLLHVETPLELWTAQQAYREHMEKYWLEMHAKYWAHMSFDPSLHKTSFRKW